MTEVTVEGQVGPQTLSDGVNSGIRQGRTGELIASELHGRYYEQTKRANTFVAHAIVTAPVIYTTAAGTGGPLLWNPPNSGIDCVLLGVGVGVTVVTTVAAAIGITGNVGQLVAPTSTTAIDSQVAGYISSAIGSVRAFRVGTVSNAGAFLMPVMDLHTGALTTETGTVKWIDLGGNIIIPPGCWGSVAASATATTTVAQIALVYEEVAI